MNNDLQDVRRDGGVEGLTPSFADIGGVETRYYEFGSGETLLLLHGGNWSGASSANAWSQVIEPFSRHFRILAFDRIGCGMTENPTNPEEYRYCTELDHALAFMHAMGVSSYHVCGSSRGAGLAARLAVKNPDAVETLLLVNSSTIGPPVGDYSFRRNRIFERPVSDYDPTRPEYYHRYYEQYCYRTEHITNEFCRTAAYMQGRSKAQETAEVMSQETHQEAWNESLRNHMRETRARLSDGVFNGPTLYILGRNDLNVPLEMAMATFDTIGQGVPRVRLNLVNNCGHMMYLEYPNEFVETVTNFIERWT